MNYFFRAIIFCLTIFINLIYSHGFGPATFVRYGHGWCDIQQICSNISRKQNQHIISNDLNTGEPITCQVKSAGSSVSPCYFKLCFQEICNDDIFCTPSQEFYIPSIKKWIPAYQLIVGDELLSERNIVKRLTYIEFVKRPLNVYSIEVEESHIFFVGRYSILTHNMVFPIMFCSGLAIPITGGVGGTIIGMLTASVPLVTATLLFTGAVGYVAKKIISDRVLHYTLSYSAAEIEQYRAHINKMDPVVPPSNVPPQLPGTPGEPPLDPNNLSEKIKKIIDASVNHVMKDSNKIHHIFDNLEHKLGSLVEKLGGQACVVRAVLIAAYSNIPENGLFQDIPVVVEGFTVYVRGRVMDDVIKLLTFFIK